MRLFGRGLILAAFLCASAPSVAGAAPIGLGSGGCAGLVASAECRLLDIDPATFAGLEGSFQTFGDIALFAFTFLEDTRLIATTSSYAAGSFDPTFGLFHGTGNILEFDGPGGLTPARFFDISLDTGDYDDRIDLVLAAGSYIMALIAFPNDFSGLPGSLQAGFACDDLSLCPEGAPGLFAFDFAATPVEEPTQSVPEPSTLALVGSAAIVAMLRRRREKRI
jgi:hypothetical protein